ncbi:MAG: hypothetical protein JWP95_2339, partial [Actinotalea sp.]|nr:hypothetical protein [Actinotalea sp.]
MTPSARGARTGLAPVPWAPLPALLGRLPVLLLVPLLVMGSTALLGLVGVTRAAPAAAGPASGLPVTMTVDAVSPQVLRPGEDLAVTVTITNTGQVSVAQPRVTVLLDRDPFISRSSLDTWREGTPEDDLGLAVLDLDLPAPLQPGETLTVPTVVPAVSVPLRTTATSWGPRGLAVRVVDKADPVRRTIGLARTFALWFPEQEVTATRVSLLAPVVGPAVDPRSPTWVAELERLTRPGGRLAALLAATADHPELGWVVDPRLVEVTPPTDGPAAPPTDEVDGADGDGASDAS